VTKRSRNDDELIQTAVYETENEGVHAEGFYTRWSRRKQAYARGEVLPQKSDTSTQPPAGVESKPIVTDDNAEETPLPPIETLTEHSDLSGFMSSRVADELRLRALRKVFHTSKFNVCDGLDDYAEDFRIFEPLGDIITADLRHHMERLKQVTTTEPEIASAQVEESDSKVAVTGEIGGDIQDDGDDVVPPEDVQDEVALYVSKSE
jgi:hypothetical protein